MYNIIEGEVVGLMTHPLLLLYLIFTYSKTLETIIKTTICPNVSSVSFSRGKGACLSHMSFHFHPFAFSKDTRVIHFIR